MSVYLRNSVCYILEYYTVGIFVLHFIRRGGANERSAADQKASKGTSLLLAARGSIAFARDRENAHKSERPGRA